MLEIKKAEKQFGERTVFSGVSFSAEAGETACIVGPSGCGKTTLLRAVAGLVPLSDGTVLLDGEDITSWKAEQRPVVLLFQEALLFPQLTVLENIAYGLKYGRRKLGRRARLAESRAMLQKIEMEQWENAYPVELSGGQKQRVALARALVLKPKLLLLDEPFSSLDASLRQSLRTWVRSFLREEEVTSLFVTHDKEEAVMMSDRLIVMKDGAVQQQGTPETVYHQPENRAAADVIGDGLYDERFIPASSLTIGAADGYSGIIEHPQFMHGYRFYRVNVPSLKQTVVVLSDTLYEEGEAVKLSVTEEKENGAL
ncbi:ABC transporter ATP-binding protein [Alkalicoccus luteus]|uniref:Carnitine transport ATP-binding protein OpuCA n=1 Tax=Alkalicoccus luteus TaxID=1237094 RepID=A0A969PRT8_9BACI|nr:ABC transporter ATP-binding protein [Alkalicoccus luteus]NJP37874.1 ABC transporter ATP-binding protein [Alkalicoccus luteus]